MGAVLATNVTGVAGGSGATLALGASSVSGAAPVMCAAIAVRVTGVAFVSGASLFLSSIVVSGPLLP